MINNNTIILFDYIYNNMYESKKNDSIKWKEFEKLCDDTLEYTPYDFISYNFDLLTMNKNHMFKDITGNKHTTGEFVKLNLSGTKEYINYKIEELIVLIKVHGVNTFKNVDDMFRHLNNTAVRHLLEVARNKNIINFNNDIFIYASNDIHSIDYDNIKVMLEETMKTNNDIILNMINNNQVITQVGDNNRANIEIITDYQLFATISDKLEAIKIEMKNIDCHDKIADLERAVNNKDRKNALEIISHLAGIGSFVASAINMLIYKQP